MATKDLRVRYAAQGIAACPHCISLPIMPTQISAALFRAQFSAGSRPSLLRQRAELPGGSVRMVVVTVVMVVVGLRKRRRGEQRDQGEQECLFHSTIISSKQRTATPIELLFWVSIGFQNGTTRS